MTVGFYSFTPLEKRRRRVIMSESNGHAKMVLSREQILAAIDQKIEYVEVPEWDGGVYVRNMTGKTRDKFERSRCKIVGKEIEIVHENTRASLLSATLCDKDGMLLFTPEDIEALGEKNGAALDRLFDVAQRLSGMGKAEVEDRAKN
jgi:hypothetical protein